MRKFRGLFLFLELVPNHHTCDKLVPNYHRCEELGLNRTDVSDRTVKNWNRMLNAADFGAFYHCEE